MTSPSGNIIQEREQRRKLYCELIGIQDIPCAQCSSKMQRQIHRIIPGHKGGEYTLNNVQVLCQRCHRHIHNNSKFKVGDKVCLNGRSPNYVNLARHRPRTVFAVYYDPQRQCNFYLLGANAKGSCDGESPKGGFGAYLFRSYQLLKWPLHNRQGRPREKRRYNLHRKSLVKPKFAKGIGQMSESDISVGSDIKALFNKKVSWI